MAQKGIQPQLVKQLPPSKITAHINENVKFLSNQNKEIAENKNFIYFILHEDATALHFF
jgi:hypothetical protein